MFRGKGGIISVAGQYLIDGRDGLTERQLCQKLRHWRPARPRVGGKSVHSVFTKRATLWLGTAVTALAATASFSGMAQAADLKGAIPPPMSVPTYQYFESHPSAYAQFLSKLAPTGAPAKATRFTAASGGKWDVVAEAPTGGLCNPLLLTDGTVIVADGDTPHWYKLTPDSSGNYADGTWSSIADLPVVNGTQYGPLYHASGVLPDGRVIIMGGEYNNSNHGVWTNSGAIYDPVANTWTPVEPPLGSAWTQIGDAQSVVLANGTFMLGACCAYHPAADALFNPKTLTWTATAAPRAGGQYQDEQGYELLPNDNVLTVDIWTNDNPVNTEKYNAAKRIWVSAGNTPTSLVDPVACGNYEIGPAVLRPDKTVVAFGGNTGCVAGATDDPTAIYSAATNSWSAGPYVPAVCGSDGTTSCTLADAPAALLPNGDILFAASSGYGSAPTHFFEYSSTNTITQVSDTKLHASTSGSYYYNFLVLPNGQILSSDFSRHLEVYTPAKKAAAAWAPVIYNAPSSVTAGTSYKIAGSQFSGRSQGAYYGDDAQMATNYPIVKIQNVATGDVVYGRTTGFSTMSVAPNTLASANFTIPANTETGASTLSVVANGISSQPVSVTVQ